MFFVIFIVFLIKKKIQPSWGPGGIPLDSQRNFDPPQGLNTPGAFFWTHFSKLLTFSGFSIGPSSSFFEKVDPRHPSQANPPCQK